VIGEVEVEEREKDAYGNVFLSARELQQQEEERRAARGVPATQARNPNMVPKAAAAAAAAATAAAAAAAAATKAAEASSEEEEEAAEERASWGLERRTAEDLTAELVAQWEKPISTLSRAGRAFEVRGGVR
jgi:hypothetical protein